ncbi:MAG: cell division protein ZapA [Elusimicrobiota bacterium]
MAKERVPIKILDTEIMVETEMEPLFVTQLAEYVNKKLEEVKIEQKTVDTLTLLRQTLIALAEEIFTLREEKENIKTELDRNVDEIILHLESAARL